VDGGIAENSFRQLWSGLGECSDSSDSPGRQASSHGGDPPERPYSSAVPEGSRDRTSDPLETHRDGGRSITPTATVSITTTASATTAVNATTSEADGSGYPWLGFAHRQPPTLVFVVIESQDRSVSLGVGVHLDKTEPLATAHITVLDDLGALHCPILGEPLLQIGMSHCIGNFLTLPDCRLAVSEAHQ